jgi:hypothetical protein
MSATHQDLPASVALFFLFIKMVISYLILRLVLADGYNLVTNWNGTDCGNPELPWMRDCIPQDKYLKASIANKVTDKYHLKILEIVNMGAVLFSIVFFFIYHFVEYREYVKHDISEQTQDDFSIFVRHIPLVLFERKASNYEEKLSALFTGIIN